MKKIVLLFSLVFSSVSFAGERIFDCSATNLTKNASVIEDANLAQNPNVLFRYRTNNNWILSVGDINYSTLIPTGPALHMAAEGAKNHVAYIFWVEGSTEFELNISVVDHTAELYYWGLGEQTLVGKFQCEVIEQ